MRVAVDIAAMRKSDDVPVVAAAAAEIKAFGCRVVEVDAYVSSTGVISLSVGNPAYIEAAKDDADG